MIKSIRKYLVSPHETVDIAIIALLLLIILDKASNFSQFAMLPQQDLITVIRLGTTERYRGGIEFVTTSSVSNDAETTHFFVLSVSYNRLFPLKGDYTSEKMSILKLDSRLLIF